MRIHSEEPFARVALPIRVSDEGRSEEQVISEMVEIANSFEYGLAASVCGRDVCQSEGGGLLGYIAERCTSTLR